MTFEIDVITQKMGQGKGKKWEGEGEERQGEGGERQGEGGERQGEGGRGRGREGQGEGGGVVSLTPWKQFKVTTLLHAGTLL